MIRKPPPHGGRVYEAAARWGIAPDEVIDFSANINPLGPPPNVLAAAQSALTSAGLRNYPDDLAFVTALAKKHDIDPHDIVIGAGSAALMFAVVRAVQPKSVLVLEPGFEEYFRAAVGVEVIRMGLKRENGFAPDFNALARIIRAGKCDMLILNSPHNPTGQLYAKEDLIALVDIAEENNVTILLDEAFIDYVPEASLLRVATALPRLVILRSLTKFYAIPGLRVGYAVCSFRMAEVIRQQIDAWPVSTVALEAAMATLAEHEYEAESRRINTRSREEFANALSNIGLSVFRSEANFLLIGLPLGTGTELSEWLEASRILIRQCNSFSGLGDTYIRLAVKSSEDNMRLVTLMGAWLRRSEEC